MSSRRVAPRSASEIIAERYKTPTQRIDGEEILADEYLLSAWANFSLREIRLLLSTTSDKRTIIARRRVIELRGG